MEEKTPARRPPEWVLEDGAPLPEQDGAGGKPQGYDSQGRYTDPHGGAASLSDGSVSTFGQEDRMYGSGQGDEE